jgi:hypothetical protein
MAPPDPKVVVDSVADGACEVLTFGPRMIDRAGQNASTFGKNITGDLTNLRQQMPDRLEVIPDTAAKVVGHCVDGVLGGVEGIVGAVGDTASGIKAQVHRVL